MPVMKAVLALGLPTMAGQIILVIYNMADTFFIGMTGSDAKLAAVTLCLPAFMFLSAISNLFGIGGAAGISRALGSKDSGRAAEICAFSFWGCLSVSAVYCAAVFIFRQQFLFLLGAHDAEVFRNADQYIFLTVVIGGIFTSVNPYLGHIIRSEGRSVHAGIGIIIGGLMNIVLDPIFMFHILPKGYEVLGAAVATALSNIIACLYYILTLVRIKKIHHTVLSFRIHGEMLRDISLMKEVIDSGLPACIMTLFENISYAVLDHLMAAEGIVYQAGIGVAKKVNMLSHCIVRGMSQGVLPLFAYNFSSGNFRRLKHALTVSALISVCISCVTTALCLAFSREFIGMFIKYEGSSLDYGSLFLRILCIGCPFSAFAYAVISFLQAIGKRRWSVVLALCRKGAIDIPLMFILFSGIRISGIVWATPITDIICCVTALMMFISVFRSLEKNGRLPNKLIRKPVI